MAGDALRGIATYARTTWTPDLTFVTAGDQSIVLSLQYGTYTRIGRLVFILAVLDTSTFTHTTASGGLVVTGLPFTVAGTDRDFIGTCALEGWTAATAAWVVPRVEADQDRIYFQANVSGGARFTLTEAHFLTGASVKVRVQGWYETDALD